MPSAGIGVVEAAPLQLGQGAADPGCQHHTGNQVIGQLGSQRVVRQSVGVHLGGDQRLRKLPYGVVTGEENDAASLQRRDGVVVRRERTFGVLVVFRVGGGTLLVRDQRVALTLPPASLASWYFSQIAGPNSARCAVPCVAETTRKSGCLNDQTCAFSELRMRFSHGLAIPVLSQTCFGAPR